MSTANHDSGYYLYPRDEDAAPELKAEHNDLDSLKLESQQADTANRMPFLNEVLACACPDCGAPMAVRVWLMSADCWRCMLSIALSLEEIETIRATEKLPQPKASKRHATEPKRTTPTHVAAIASIAPPEAIATPNNSKEAILDKFTLTAPPVGDGPLLAPAVVGTEARHTPGELLTGSGLSNLLAWLISAIVHLLLMILLGLLFPGSKEERAPQIVLSVDYGRQRIAGERLNEHDDVLMPDFELPVTKKPTNQKERSRLKFAALQARSLRVDPNSPSRSLPPLNRVRDELAANDPYERMHATRDPRVRAQVIRQEGGTTQTEAAVARALVWLSRHQSSDGSWKLNAFHKSADCQGRCGGRGHLRSSTGGTGLALQAFLGAGQTHKSGIYRNAVSRGLRYLVEAQDSDGDLRGDSSGNAGMYAHAQAAIVLCDAYKMTGDAVLKRPAQKAIDFICKAQHRRGGWRYEPGSSGDTSVIGWQLMALHSARAAKLNVPEKTLKQASRYLDRAQVKQTGGALYAYRPGDGPSASMTAEGLLCRMYLGWNKSNAGLRRGVQVLMSEHLPEADDPQLYYWYYGTQVMHHWGGKPWVRWNRTMRDILVTSQETEGHEAGSWYFRTDHSGQGGRIYMTALACCTLETYYRHAPLFRKIELE